MELVKTTIRAGAEAPFRLLHITDTHLTYADGRDGRRKVALAESRARVFHDENGSIERHLDEAITYARDGGMLLVHTGDLIDFVSRKNLEVARKKLTGVDCMMAAGNHEFSLYVGEAFEDEAYKARSFDRVQAVFANDISFSSRVVGGVNLIFIDNSYYLFSRRQLDALRRELDRGLPSILFFHNPLHTPALYADRMQAGPCAYLTGTPEELLACYPPDRYRQQKPDAVTLETIACITASPFVKAIVAGHLHIFHDGALDCGIPQYVTGAGYDGCAREITVI